MKKYRPKYNSTDPGLEKISNAMLDHAYEPTAADIELLSRDPDPDDRLAKHFGSLKPIKGRGHQTFRPRDAPLIVRELWSEANLLRRLWEEHGVEVSGRGVNVSPELAAFKIVVRRSIADQKERTQILKQLIVHDSNRGRKRK